jgi:DNA-binding CsgD family transcriptional regulator
VQAEEPRRLLIGRKPECEALDRLLASARAGTGAALVLGGEAGVGKTALLDYVAVQAEGFHIARASGVESEVELVYAGLHQVCAPLLDRIDALPPPQRDALGTAFGLRTAEAPDRFLVGLAVLTLLSDAAERRPIVCILDDAQWLDRASLQVLAFVARRLAAESIVIVFAAREPERDLGLAGLPRLAVGALRDDDARTLLRSVVPGKLDDTVRDMIVAEANGNPLVLLEVSRTWTPAMLAGGLGMPPEGSVERRIEESFRLRLDGLPDPTRQLLLITASECIGDPTVIWGAAESLGIHADAVSPATEAGLLATGTELRFRHPLVRSVVYEEASVGDRQRAHLAVAEAIDPTLDPDRRAWHRAQASPGPDDEIALDLERSAERTQRRAGLAAAAAVLGKAAQLTLEPAARSERALVAAQATHAAGAPADARGWLTLAEAGPLDAHQRARAHWLRGQIAFTLNRGTDAPPLLLRAAKELETLDPALARETYLDALTAVQFAGFMADDTAREIAQAARAAPALDQPRPVDVLLDGLSLLLTDGRPTAVPVLRRAVDGFLSGDPADAAGSRWMWLVAVAALELWDEDSWEALTRRQVALVREAGALTMLPLALTSSIYAHVLTGDLAGSVSLVDEVESVRAVIGNPIAPYGALVVAAWRGRGEAVATLSEAIIRDAEPRGEGLGVTTTQWANALYQNSIGGYAHALEYARPALDRPSRLTLAGKLVLVELIEAAARAGQPDPGSAALERLSADIRASASDWGLGLLARSQALLVDEARAEPLYGEAIDRLGRTRLSGELGRAHLVFGEWLRRGNRRLDARRELRAAHEVFVSIGADAFAERADGELRATGETVRKRTDAARDELTPQELQIARLAGDGQTNPEIAAQLFLSPRTVEWHLRKVFAKLGVASRRELRATLGSGPDSRPRR